MTDRQGEKAEMSIYGDICARLREAAEAGDPGSLLTITSPALFREAANEIELLRSEVRRLRERGYQEAQAHIRRALGIDE